MRTVHSPRDGIVEGHPAGSREYGLIVAALFLAGLATFALLYSTQAVLPALSRQFGVSPAQSTLAMSVTTAGLGLALLVAGPLSDLIGRTRLIHLSLASTSALAILTAIAPTWQALLWLRGLEGVALAGLPAVATSYLREELDPRTHARVAGLYIGGTALGGMVGRLLSGAVAEFAGWRWALAAIGMVACLCAVSVWMLLPASRRFVPAPGGLRPTLRMTRRALADPALLKLYAIAGCSMGAMVAMLNTVGFRLEGAPFHLGVGAASLVFLVYPLGSISSAVSGRIADAVGRRPVLPVGAVIAVIGVLVTLSHALPVLVAGLALLTIGFFVVHGIASGWVPARAHAGGVSSAQAASIYLFTYYAGSSIFGSVAGVAWSGVGWSGVVVLAGGLLVVSGLLALSLRNTRSLLNG